MSIDETLKVVHHFSDGLYAKETPIPKDIFLQQHKHNYSHLSILSKGKVAVKKDGCITIYEAPTCINIEANKEHSVMALEDSVWYCIHATTETNENNIDQVLVVKGV